MTRARILILLVAIGSAILAAVLAKGVIGRQAGVSVEEAKPETVPVLLAARDLAAGERLDVLAVEWKDWPRENVASFMITRDSKPNAMEEIEGSRAQARIFRGEPIADSKILSAKKGGLMSYFLPKGMRAVSIAVSEQTASGGFILPNDRVDIIATLRVKVKQSESDGDEKEVVFSRSIVNNVRVLAMNQTFNSEGDTASLTELKTAVLELDPVQAEVVARSEAQGQLSLALRSIAEVADGDMTEERPSLASATEDPNGVFLYRSGMRMILSCGTSCDPTLQMMNAPFPLIVRDVGIENATSNR